MEVAFSCSIKAMQASGSKRRISTSLTPVARAMFSSEKQPVTWKNGMATT